MKYFLLITVLSLFSIGCAPINSETIDENVEMVEVEVVGSAEYPDPVLNRVEELAEQGVIDIVAIRESFPVQIRIIGPTNMVKELELIPRKK